jgi:hypothetical protein
MNTPLDTLLAGERAKIELLRTKIRECEQRIATLQAMQSDDDLDAALTRRLQGGAAADPVTQVVAPHPILTNGPRNEAIEVPAKAKTGDFPKKALNGSTLKLLRFADGTDKSIDEFLVFASQNGISKERQGMRAFLHQYKATYGLLRSDRAGHFRLSDSGAAYLEAIKPRKGEPSSAS